MLATEITCASSTCAPKQGYSANKYKGIRCPERLKLPFFQFSDHQLKNSSNPAVLEWLAHKNELARRNRIYRFRENRSKRDRLMQEHNEREDKRANALIEYERWKKKKNR